MREWTDYLQQADPLVVLFVFGFFWLVVLTFFLFRMIVHYRRLTAGVTKKDLKSALEKILADIKKNQKQIKEVNKVCQEIEEKGGFHFQKIGFLRYNPFRGTGGDQSFILALLDEHDDGLVITSLHSREMTRVYAKPVKKGQAGQYELSAEEKKVIKKAKKAKFL